MPTATLNGSRPDHADQTISLIQTTPEPDQTTGPDWERIQTGLKTAWSKVHDAIGLVPLIAPLIAAGFYQADLARSEFGWGMPWCLVFPLSIEAGAAWSAGNYHRKLVAGDSTIAARLGMLAYAGASAALLYWHARTTGKPPVAAVAISGMTLAAVWIWTQRAKHMKRDQLRRRGLVDQQVPHFSAARWILCPIETARVFRWSVKYSQSDPTKALAAYRQQTRPDEAPDQTKPAKQTRPKQTKAPRPADHAEPDQQTRPVATADQELVQTIQTSYPDWQTKMPSANQIKLVVGGGQTRALRLQRTLKEIAA